MNKFLDHSGDGLRIRPEAADPDASKAWQEGRVSPQTRVAVTGHRDLPQKDPGLLNAIREVLEHIDASRRSGTRSTPVGTTVVSALAEGADRIVAREAMRRGSRLEVVLPFDRAEYLRDFDSRDSQQEYESLLEAASSVAELPPTDDRDEAYERVGRAVVDRANILVALWDGQPARGRGGTAEIVAYAHRRRVPVVQIQVRRSADESDQIFERLIVPPGLEVTGQLSDRAFEMLDRFNSFRLPGEDRIVHAPLLPPDLTLPVPPFVERYIQYMQPYFDRAEHVAQLSQRLFLRFIRLLFSLAAFAVIIVATQIIFFSSRKVIVWGEVVALAAVIVILVVGRRGRWHDSWISARYLAERLRSSVFLVATGALDLSESTSGRARVPDAAHPEPGREWADRAFLEICRPETRAGDMTELDVPALRSFLIEAWIDDQARYHQKTSLRLAGKQRRLTFLAIGLFSVSAIVALLHSMGAEIIHHHEVWGYLSVVIPAIGAALSGYGAQREYSRLAERSRLMVVRLKDMRQSVTEAESLAALRKAARRTELLMRSETADWYDVVRMHDLEVPA
jgi:hypothetical protein